MEIFTQFGVPILAMIISGGMIWASLQAIKAAIVAKKWWYIPATAGLAMVAAILVTMTAGAVWSWKTYCWVAWGGWLAAHLLHKFYARYLEEYINKFTNGKNGQPT